MFHVETTVESTADCAHPVFTIKTAVHSTVCSCGPTQHEGTANKILIPRRRHIYLLVIHASQQSFIVTMI